MSGPAPMGRGSPSKSAVTPAFVPVLIAAQKILDIRQHTAQRGIEAGERRRTCGSSVGFAQPGRKPLNRMQFCTAKPNGSRLAGGGAACERDTAGLADYKYGTRDAGGLWGICAATWSAGSAATGADCAENARVGPAGEAD